MRTLIKALWFLGIALTLNLIIQCESKAQVFGKSKMPVGVKFYEVDIENPETGEIATYSFADMEGQYDIFDFKNLDTTVAAQKRSMVFDDKLKTWRLPLNAELTGVVDPKRGDMVRQYFYMGGVRPALRHRVE